MEDDNEQRADGTQSIELSSGEYFTASPVQRRAQRRNNNRHRRQGSLLIALDNRCAPARTHAHPQDPLTRRTRAPSAASFSSMRS